MARGRTLLVAIGLAGCASQPHVQLEAPDPSSPEEARLAAYERLRAKPRAGYLGETYEDLQLGDGSRVWHAEDILPVVPERSRAAVAARRSESLRATSTGLLVGGGGVVLAGTAWLAVGLSDEPDAFLGSTSFALALGTVALGVVTLALSAVPEWEANDATSTAFVAYDRALRRRLNLCVADLRLVACR